MLPLPVAVGDGLDEPEPDADGEEALLNTARREEEAGVLTTDSASSSRRLPPLPFLRSFFSWGGSCGAGVSDGGGGCGLPFWRRRFDPLASEAG